MSEEQKKQLEQQLWNIANVLRGKMNADEYKNYILGFIFYKYLSEKQEVYANELLKQDGKKYLDLQNEKKHRGNWKLFGKNLWNLWDFSCVQPSSLVT